MKKLRKFAIFLMIPLHLILMYSFTHGWHDSSFYLLEVLILVLADFALSFWQMEILTSRRNRISVFAHVFLPYLLQNLLMIAAEFVVIFVVCEGEFSVLGGELGIFVAWAAGAAVALLCALVTFVTGAARTMMYHDEQK